MSDWDLLIRQARSADLLGRLWREIALSGLVDSVPEAPTRHLQAAKLLVERQQDAVRREIVYIDEAIRASGLRAILLKGAAYVATGKALAVGRTFSDVDILVGDDDLAMAEKAFSIYGWQPAKQSAYDEAYYRKWMHEIPPLVHVKRNTTLDLHHAILPRTARIKVNTQGLLEHIVLVDGCTNLYVLQETDMLLHSATHLFHEGELAHGLRDLHDLHLMFGEFGALPSFWNDLLIRAQYLGLMVPLLYAVRYSRRKFHTVFPQAFLRKLESYSAQGSALMDFCYDRALLPKHASCERFGSGVARVMVYLRSHWLKMPLGLLVYHLSVKSLARLGGKESKSTTE
ncbi:nucleotidyltransferase family protein [Dechloromonas sp. ARDL1]|uniref:nucleotidyltransferase domain-containing protein n=1 Tax=Dechloromonas sp. ARDL1 TaxID=3322121 RepID=UPI003DA6FB88